MEKRMDNSAFEISSINKKIDFLIETLISKGQAVTVGIEGSRPHIPRAGTTPSCPVQKVPHDNESPPVSGSGGKTCSLSVVSHDLGSEGIPLHEIGTSSLIQSRVKGVATPSTLNLFRYFVSFSEIQVALSSVMCRKMTSVYVEQEMAGI